MLKTYALTELELIAFVKLVNSMAETKAYSLEDSVKGVLLFMESSKAQRTIEQLESIDRTPEDNL